MPKNDPHTAAPSLWVWQDAEGFECVCSATPLIPPHPAKRSTVKNFGMIFLELENVRLSGILTESVLILTDTEYVVRKKSGIYVAVLETGYPGGTQEVPRKYPGGTEDSTEISIAFKFSVSQTN